MNKALIFELGICVVSFHMAILYLVVHIIESSDNPKHVLPHTSFQACRFSSFVFYSAASSFSGNAFELQSDVFIPLSNRFLGFRFRGFGVLALIW